MHPLESGKVIAFFDHLLNGVAVCIEEAQTGQLCYSNLSSLATSFGVGRD
jgi:hypothetical protein